MIPPYSGGNSIAIPVGITVTSPVFSVMSSTEQRSAAKSPYSPECAYLGTFAISCIFFTRTLIMFILPWVVAIPRVYWKAIPGVRQTKKKSRPSRELLEGREQIPHRFRNYRGELFRLPVIVRAVASRSTRVAEL